MTPSFDPSGVASRQTRLARLRGGRSPAVLVLGGGINGISVYRELALQGVDVVLVEKGDYCSGASGAPSRLIHGGLRYLENGEFGLVRESLAERNRLLANAPHYVSPLPIVLPIFDYVSGVLTAAARIVGLRKKPSRRGAAIVKIGLLLYDLYTRKHRIMPRHKFAGRHATRARWPHLAPGVKCAATYYDAWITYPERLGFEMLEDVAAVSCQATALNYVSFVGMEATRVVLEDGPSGERFRLSPSILVNATGAWIDIVNHGVAGRHTKPMMGGAKGSHLIVRNKLLLRELDGHMVYYENQEGRICILFPYFGNVLVGSTDIWVDDPDAVRCEADERDYILESLRFVFPSIAIRAEDVLYTFCGVRPLPRSDAAVPGRVSRNHSCKVIAASNDRPFETMCMIGGKWTTFRSFGEEVADVILARLDLRRIVSTQNLPIGGGAALPKTVAQRTAWLHSVSRRTSVPAERILELAPRYGSRAERIAAFIAMGPDRPLVHHPEYSRREILFLIRAEDVVTLKDIVVRCTSLAISGTLDMGTLEEIAEILAADRAWSDRERNEALDRTLADLTDKHGQDVRGLAKRIPQ